MRTSIVATSTASFKACLAATCRAKMAQDGLTTIIHTHLMGEPHAAAAPGLCRRVPAPLPSSLGKAGWRPASQHASAGPAVLPSCIASRRSCIRPSASEAGLGCAAPWQATFRQTELLAEAWSVTVSTTGPGHIGNSLTFFPSRASLSTIRAAACTQQPRQACQSSGPGVLTSYFPPNCWQKKAQDR